ncbi:hypothetical protein [uncultured Limnohabitans sp.]|uniref:hypothetical protein n=1 Tax=uncultured Limnohabitans sp. TaxID=768543 RepID=UPI0026374112|nr:hypothetical protein [uncultured Limnohabitans sp.]
MKKITDTSMMNEATPSDWLAAAARGGSGSGGGTGTGGGGSGGGGSGSGGGSGGGGSGGGDGEGGGSGGGKPEGAGSKKGDLYGDQYVLLRDVNPTDGGQRRAGSGCQRAANLGWLQRLAYLLCCQHRWRL